MSTWTGIEDHEGLKPQGMKGTAGLDAPGGLTNPTTIGHQPGPTSLLRVDP